MACGFPSTKDAARKKFEKVKKPYLYYYGAASNSMDYIVFCMWDRHPSGM